MKREQIEVTQICDKENCNNKPTNIITQWNGKGEGSKNTIFCCDKGYLIYNKGRYLVNYNGKELSGLELQKFLYTS